MERKNPIKNALSVDIEDWFHGILQINYKDWPKYESRLAQNVTKILLTLAAYDVKATFFILGYIAETNPEIIEEIAKAGHEIASHGYYHQPVYSLSPEQFREDVLRSKQVIEAIIKTKIRGYRAPFFSITKDSLWALGILNDLGFEYDSSIFPMKNFLYGVSDAPQTIYKIENTELTEFPLSVIKIIGLRLPVCGGFYFRSLPYSINKAGIKMFNKKGWPVIMYIHPWEIDVEKPSIPMALKWKIIHEYNIDKMEDKVKQLIKDFSFTTVSSVLYGS